MTAAEAFDRARRAPDDDYVPPGDVDDPHGPMEPSSWRPVDLTAALAGVELPPPTMMARTDGVCLLYPGRTHGFAGESESCKSWAALVEAATRIAAGDDVLWLDFEDDDKGVVSRLLALMARPDAIQAHFVYVRPEEPLTVRNGAVTSAEIDFVKLLAARPWALIVIDGVTVSMSAEGLDIVDNGDIARWMRLLPRRCADTGAATVMIDHVAKAVEGRGRYAIGGQHKLAAVTGCQFVFEVETPFARAHVDERTGIIRVTVTKDRPGHVRARAVDGVVARLNLTSYPDGGVSAALVAPGASQIDLRLASEIAGHLTVYPGSSKNAVEKALDVKAGRVRSMLQTMVTSGWVAVEKVGQAHLHTLTEAGAEYFG